MGVIIVSIDENYYLNNFRCDICKQMRHTDKISIRTVDMYPNDPGCAFRNIKFCNDNLNCQLQAEKIEYYNGNVIKR